MLPTDIMLVDIGTSRISSATNTSSSPARLSSPTAFQGRHNLRRLVRSTLIALAALSCPYEK